MSIVANNIDTKDISIVFQGAVAKDITYKCIQSAKKILPDAEIILSTWKNSDWHEINKLKEICDLVVLNKDPGSIECKNYHSSTLGKTSNIFRQILSAREGLLKATKKYAIKTRTDIAFIDNNFLNYFDIFAPCEDKNLIKINKKYTFLKKRVIIPSVFTNKVNYHHKKDNCFRYSDWFTFGLKEDVEKIWNIEIENDPDFAIKNNVIINKSKSNLLLSPASNYHEEQYIWGNLIKQNISKKDEFEFLHENDYSAKNSTLSEIILVNNIVVVDYENFGIQMLKNERKNCLNKDLYSYCDWLRLYKKYCNKDYKIKDEYNLLLKHKICVFKSTTKRHLMRIKKNFNSYKDDLKKEDFITIIAGFFINLIKSSYSFILVIYNFFNIILFNIILIIFNFSLKLITKTKKIKLFNDACLWIKHILFEIKHFINGF